MRIRAKREHSSCKLQTVLFFLKVEPFHNLKDNCLDQRKFPCKSLKKPGQHEGKGHICQEMKKGLKKFETFPVFGTFG